MEATASSSLRYPNSRSKAVPVATCSKGGVTGGQARWEPLGFIENVVTISIDTMPNGAGQEVCSTLSYHWHGHALKGEFRRRSSAGRLEENEPNDHCRYA